MAPAGNAWSRAFSSWRHATSGFSRASHLSSADRRLVMPFTLKVAIFTASKREPRQAWPGRGCLRKVPAWAHGGPRPDGSRSFEVPFFRGTIRAHVLQTAYHVRFSGRGTRRASGAVRYATAALHCAAREGEWEVNGFAPFPFSGTRDAAKFGMNETQEQRERTYPVKPEGE